MHCPSSSFEIWDYIISLANIIVLLSALNRSLDSVLKTAAGHFVASSTALVDLLDLGSRIVPQFRAAKGNLSKTRTQPRCIFDSHFFVSLNMN